MGTTTDSEAEIKSSLIRLANDAFELKPESEVSYAAWLAGESASHGRWAASARALGWLEVSLLVNAHLDGEAGETLRGLVERTRQIARDVMEMVDGSVGSGW